MERIFFWKPYEQYGFLSQWYKSKIEEKDKDGVVHIFSCAEQYMMYNKAILFGDFGTATQILKTNDPKQIKALGRIVKNFDQNIWDENKYEIVVKGNYLKFFQNEDLKSFLLDTNDAFLAEASPYDRIWGIGVNALAAKISNAYPGKNLLGKALMEVRTKLQNEE